MNRVMHRFPEPSLPSPSLGIVPSFKSWQLLFSCPRPFTSSSGHPSPMLIILYTLSLSRTPALVLFWEASPLLRAGPPAGDVDPFGHTAALLAFHVDNIGIAAAPAAHAVLLWRVPVLPVVVLLEPLALVRRRLLEVRLPRQLSTEGRVGRAVLDGRVSVAKVTEVVNVARGQ